MAFFDYARPSIRHSTILDVQPTAMVAHSICMEMVWLKDRPGAEVWQGGDTEEISLFTLSEAVAFSKVFFLPLRD